MAYIPAARTRSVSHDWRYNLRREQVRLATRLANKLARVKIGLFLIRLARRSPLCIKLLAAVCGYQKKHATLFDAQAAIANFANLGHRNAHSAEFHLALNAEPRPSDFKAMEQVIPHLDQIGSIFDLGGNVGNICYCYRQYFGIPDSINWTVLDIPEITEIGSKLARERHAHNLDFVTAWSKDSAFDLLIASGSIHYLAETLDEKIAHLAAKPKFVLINRTPLTAGDEFCAVQDAGAYMVACVVRNRGELVRKMESLGYRLVSQWQCEECSLSIAFDPDHTIESYTGMFFRFSDPSCGTCLAGRDGRSIGVARQNA